MQSPEQRSHQFKNQRYVVSFENIDSVVGSKFFINDNNLPPGWPGGLLSGEIVLMAFPPLPPDFLK